MKLGTRLLVVSSVFLVLLPVFGFYFSARIEQAILQGQEEAQSMTASAIALVLKGYSGLFNVDRNAIYVYPAVSPISIDGYAEDWYPLQQRFTDYAKGAFSLLLVNDDQHLYAYLKVKDAHIVYRDPRNVPLDTSDHIRLEYLDKNNRRQRLVLITEGEGTVSVYRVKTDWASWVNGQHVNAVYGVWRETPDGYDLEFRLPLAWLEPNRRMSLGIMNVFNENERYPASLFTTHDDAPGGVGNKLNPLLFQSSEISNIINNLSESESRICVVDRYRRIRAVIGGQALHSTFCRNIEKVDAKLVGAVLAGEASHRVTRLEAAGDSLIVAVQAVADGDDIIGAVLVSKNSRQVLAQQRETLVEVILVAVLIVALIIFSLLVFSYWLAFRINRLKKQTSQLIDKSGRFTREVVLPDCASGDEIGELSRSFSALLAKLNRYTRFLESVPRMLRHEILNPVNTISLSLQSIGQAEPAPAIDTASQAIEQLERIVISLTEAASIDEALAQDEFERLDIAALLTEYVANIQRRYPQQAFDYRGPSHGVSIQGSDIRLVQLLDKLTDNAVDFARPGTCVRLELDLGHSDRVIIRIKNEGDTIADEHLAMLFQGMSSRRSVKTGKPHLGIGLYVANRIARSHRGQLEIANRGDKTGVEVSLVLPLA